jgi:hypothetical protein
MNQVHKENLTHVENANPGRQGLEIEIFGMEGVPAEIIDQHNQQVTQAHFAEEQERARVTGNPIRGLYENGEDGVVLNKRPKVTETLEDIEQRADKYRTDRKNGVLPAPKEVVPSPVCCTTLSMYRGTMANASLQAPQSQQQQPFYPPTGFPPPLNGAAAIPARSDSIPGAGGALPPRPAVDAIQSSIDDLIAGVSREAPDKKEKSKKDKNMRLIYNDDLISPEEKMAMLPRFAEFVRV